jgi:methyl-accepting chemotaxis protein
LATPLPLPIHLVTAPTTDPYPAQRRTLFKAFCVALGGLGGLALVWAVTSGVPGFSVTATVPQIRGLLLFGLLALGVSYFRFRVGEGTYNSITEIALLGAVLALGPGAAALIAFGLQIWVELLIARRGLFFAARSAGMFTLVYLGGGLLYVAYARAVGLTFPLQPGGPDSLFGNIPAAALGLLLLYAGAHIINDGIMILARSFYGETPLGYLRSAASITLLVDSAQLPVALLTALLFNSLSSLGFMMWIGILLGLASLLKRLGEATGQLRIRVAELASTAAQLHAERAAKARLEEELTRTSVGLRAVAEAQARELAEQAGAVTQVSITVEELSQSARQIAQAADTVAQAATQAVTVAGGGREAMSNNLTSMTRIQEQVDTIIRGMEVLHASTGQVSQIVALIGEIADETHLLALNATIEAAGAGEQGRRFGVVAAEVNNLAARALGAARNVQTILREIEQANAAALAATHQGAVQVTHGVALSRQSEQAHDAIIAMVQQANALAHSISQATQQQRTASEQVATTMHQLADGVRASAVSSRQVLASATTLNQLAEELGTGRDA